MADVWKLQCSVRRCRVECRLGNRVCALKIRTNKECFERVESRASQCLLLEVGGQDANERHSKETWHCQAAVRAPMTHRQAPAGCHLLCLDASTIYSTSHLKFSTAVQLPMMAPNCSMSLALILILLTCAVASLPSPQPNNNLAPLYGLDVRDKWPDEYVIMFQDGYSLDEHFHNIGRNLSHSAHFAKYSFGYQATMDRQTLDDFVRRDPNVLLVETNRPVYLIQPVDVVYLEPWRPPCARNTRILDGQCYKL